MFISPRLEPFIRTWREGRRLVVLTAYDASQARLAEAAGVDLLMVGDSLGMVIQGRESTAGVTLDDMLYHTRCASRGRVSCPIVSDLPIHTYQTPDQALESAKLLMAAGADCVKFEGNPPGVAAALVQAGIPVMGHLGLLPQTAEDYKVRGKAEAEAAQIRADAVALADAGCFSLVLECIPLTLGGEVTRLVDLPTIGIGAGPQTSGQVLVFHDLLHFTQGHKAKFVPQNYPKVGPVIRSVIESYAADVRSGTYPSDLESYH